MLKETLAQLLWSVIIFAVAVGGVYLYTHTACSSVLHSCVFIGW